MSHLILNIHHQTPELRKIKKVAEALNDGAVILYPTDTAFTLGCGLSNKNAIERIRQIRKYSLKDHLTFLCPSLSNVSEFAQVSNHAYKMMKSLIPGPYTFVLPASSNVPRFAQNPKRKTAGIRVPDNNISQLLMKYLEMPLLSITAKTEDGDILDDPDELIEYFTPKVDIAVRSEEYSFVGESTVIDMTQDEFKIIREGAGYEQVTEFFPD